MPAVLVCFTPRHVALLVMQGARIGVRQRDFRGFYFFKDPTNFSVITCTSCRGTAGVAAASPPFTSPTGAAQRAASAAVSSA